MFCIIILLNLEVTYISSALALAKSLPPEANRGLPQDLVRTAWVAFCSNISALLEQRQC